MRLVAPAAVAPGPGANPYHGDHHHRNPAFVVERVMINGMSTIKQALTRTDGKWKSQRVRLSRMPLPHADCVLLHELLCTHYSVVGLELLDCEMEKEDLWFILSHLRDYHLNTLQVSRLPLGDRGATLIAVGIQESALKNVDAAWNDITKAGAHRIADALPDSGLEHLSLAQNQIGEGVVRICEVIASGRTMLKSLDVSRNEIIDHGALALADALPHSQLVSVGVKYNRLTPRGVSALCEAVTQTPTMMEIFLSGNQLGNPTCADAVYNMLAKSKNLEVVGVAHSNLTPNELPRLAEGVLACSSLKRFKMGQNQYVNDASVTAFANRIKSHPNLMELDVEDCGISAGTKQYVNRVVRRMNSPSAKVLVFFSALWTIPRLSEAYPWFKLDAGMARLLCEALGEDDPPPPLPGPPVYQFGLPPEVHAPAAAAQLNNNHPQNHQQDEEDDDDEEEEEEVVHMEQDEGEEQKTTNDQQPMAAGVNTTAAAAAAPPAAAAAPTRVY